MWGSKNVKPIHGNWHHVGYLTTEELFVPTGGTLTKGTWCMSKAGNEFVMQLASGVAIGFLTQDITNEGQTSLQSFKDRTLGVLNLPIKKGQAVSLRVMDDQSEIEFEGLGAAVPGNLVCTSGTGSIAANAARLTELSFLNGCIRIAQSTDVVQLLLLDANLTPETVGSRRIRVRVVGGYIKA